MTDREQRIRDIAYFLWLEEGSPEGGAERHWLAAEGMVGSEPEGEARVEGELPTELKKEPSSIAAAGVGLSWSLRLKARQEFASPSVSLNGARALFARPL